jgi:hypothetical protein
MAILNLDLAAQLDIEGLYAYLDWPTITLEQFEDDGKTAKDFTGTYKMVFSEHADFRDNLFVLTEIAGLTKTTNQLIIDKPQNISVKAGKLYHIILNTTIDGDIIPAYVGVTIIKHAPQWPS